ncbi:MAG: DUF92 domain-containing protein [Calditrichia bacterium]
MDLTHVSIRPAVTDWLHVGLLFSIILVFIAVAEWLRHRLNWPQEVTRKTVHISVGLLMLSAPVLLKSSIPLLLIGLFFTIFNYLALKKNWLPGIHIDRSNLGTVYYPFSFFLLVLLFWGANRIVIIAAVWVMAVGDASAAIVGQRVKRPHRYSLGAEPRSLEGSMAMLISSTLGVFLTFLLYPSELAMLNGDTWLKFAIAFAGAMAGTASESLGRKGNDNLYAPLISSVVIYYLISHTKVELLNFYVGTSLGAAFAYSAYRLRALNSSGAVAVFLLAMLIFGFGGWAWTVPILTFFILSSILSKTGKKIKQCYDLVFEKGHQRDHGQVAANGGIAAMALALNILFPGDFWYFVYLGAIAAATADTWATEIGVLFGHSPRLITNFKPVPSGTSGGITVAGLAGSILGALVVGISAIPFYPPALEPQRMVGLITLVGLIGALFDSLAGATVQAQFRCPDCQKITERRAHCSERPTVLIKGKLWVNNDLVNLFCTFMGGLAALCLFTLI